MTGLLAVGDVSVAYGRFEAVSGVSLDVAEGAIVTVIGANGAGKTTLLNAIMGLLPSSGDIIFRGAPLRHLAIEARVGMGMSLVPERRELFTGMSVRDNLALGAFLIPRAERGALLDMVYGRFPRLAERHRQMAGTLSGGERQMLAMGRALMAKPRLLMLDEPSLGLAPRIVADIFRIIDDLRRDGQSILLVEQNARAALALADEAYVMELSTIVMRGRAADLATDPRVVETYLGLAKG